MNARILQLAGGMLLGQFDDVVFWGFYAAFVVAVSCGARTAQDFVAVGGEPGGEGIDGCF